uniref:Uncharacterized protein LOC107484176 isoform X1 n=1 Tax=Rhizophora mucronata TaxID=61149 RepID=A0A2P2QAH5_RHIMU
MKHSLLLVNQHVSFVDNQILVSKYLYLSSSPQGFGLMHQNQLNPNHSHHQLHCDNSPLI